MCALIVRGLVRYVFLQKVMASNSRCWEGRYSYIAVDMVTSYAPLRGKRSLEYDVTVKVD